MVPLPLGIKQITFCFEATKCFHKSDPLLMVATFFHHNFYHFKIQKNFYILTKTQSYIFSILILLHTYPKLKYTPRLILIYHIFYFYLFSFVLFPKLTFLFLLFYYLVNLHVVVILPNEDFKKMFTMNSLMQNNSKHNWLCQMNFHDQIWTIYSFKETARWLILFWKQMT